MSAKKGGRKKGSGSGGENEMGERAEWISARLEEYGEGVHRLNAPAVVLDSELPLAVDSVYREFDGGELFHESLILLSGSQIQHVEGRFHVGEYSGDEIFVADDGSVWRLEKDTDESLPEGTQFDRWLAGVIDAESVLYEKDGEFRDDIFDEEGELTDSTSMQRERKQLQRDPKAIAPRWRLARALSNMGEIEKARDNLESVVEQKGDFSWAWFDLARISEQLGQAEAACDEAMMAAESQPGYAYAGFFLGHAARFASAAGLEERSRDLASRALQLDPELPRRNRESARELIEAGDKQAARVPLEVAKLLAPRDLETLDLLRQLAAPDS